MYSTCIYMYVYCSNKTKPCNSNYYSPGVSPFPLGSSTTGKAVPEITRGVNLSSVAPLKSLYFHWTAICSSSIVFTPRSLFLLFVLLFSGPIVEDLTTAATPPVNLRENPGCALHWKYSRGGALSLHSENEISLYIIDTCSDIQVRRIKKVITKDKMS